MLVIEPTLIVQLPQNMLVHIIYSYVTFEVITLLKQKRAKYRTDLLHKFRNSASWHSKTATYICK